MRSLSLTRQQLAKIDGKARCFKTVLKQKFLECGCYRPALHHTVLAGLVAGLLGFMCSAPWAQSTSSPSSRTQGAVAAFTAVTPEQLAIADRVMTGLIACEFGQQVLLEPIAEQPAHFRLAFKGSYYTVVPEATNTGAVRLEDKRAGVLWLQIPSKSMLINTKIGQRLVDDCVPPQARR